MPFALWSAARGLGDYEQAFWATAQVGGDVDTTCAIVGGVVAAGEAGAPPAEWLERTEALPDWLPAGRLCCALPDSDDVAPPGRATVCR